MNDETKCYATRGNFNRESLGIIKRVYTVTTLTDMDTEEEIYKVVRNYKNGKSKTIGREYKTLMGARNMARHRNACHFDRYGTSYVRVK